ncbi:MAG TPA: SCO family protein [Gemmatimonadales bacterium]|nr:SCO family protein [Gemmatimonadales bacterium]HRZ09702.1 SCO family protein [Gemmatimonadales bacterium]
MKTTKLLPALLAMALLVCTACEARRAPSAGTPEAGGESAAREYPNPRPKPNFLLTDTEGRPFPFRDSTEGSMTLLFFGYTHCPDVCPVHMANIAAALHKLPDNVARQVKVVFVTTDPERDTPQVIRAWLDHFDKRFIGLTGTQAEVDSAQVAMRLPPAYREDIPGAPYQVGHSAHVIAFTKDGMARFALPFGTRQSEWAQEIPRLVAYPGQP